LFLTGFTFLSGLLVLSFVYSWMTNGEIPQTNFLYDANGKLVDVSPLSPHWKMPLGSDMYGYSMLSKIIIGAKFTILGALAVALIRVGLGIPLGFLVGIYGQRYKRWITAFVDSFHYVPLTVVAFYLLFPVLWEPREGFQTTLMERIVYEVLILSLLTVPVVVVLVGNEAERLLQEEFIVCSKTLGASTFRIIRKHLIPMMKEKLVLIFGQQVMQTLIILSHLGLLQLFFGGTNVSYDPLFKDPPLSISNEWSGLIGSSLPYFKTAPWMLFGPIAFFGLTMLAIAFIMEGYVRATAGYSYYFTKKKKEKMISRQNAETTAASFHFELVKRHSLKESN
jgi:peptide/nickel transport system permease protein